MYFWHHSKQIDIDGDGLLDIVTTSTRTLEEGGSCWGSIPNPFDMPVELDRDSAKIEWYRNLGNNNFEYHKISDSLGGVFIDTYDIDGDQDQDIVVSHFFWGTERPALVWLEQTAAPAVGNAWKGTWSYHVIDNTTGLGYYFEFHDIDADGTDELVYCNHNNQNNTAITYNGSTVVTPGLYYFDIPANPASTNQWNRNTIYEGFRVSLNDMGNPESQGSPGLFSIGDIDLNGMPDIAISGDGNDSLYLLRQRTDHTWEVSRLDEGPMFGDVKIYDLDDDGVLEIIGSNHNYGIPTIPDGFIKIYDPNITASGMNSQAVKKINLYPNPANTILWISGTEARFTVTNILGENVTAICDIQLAASNLVSVDVSQLSAGTYFIHADGHRCNKFNVVR
jgi:hypothetical protein